MSIHAERFLDSPIVHQQMCESLGNNINGPTIIRVPEWIEKPLGRYYLYFAHHEGQHIRMAFSNSIAGPWTIHKPGVLHLKQSLFPFDPASIQVSMENADPLSLFGVQDHRPHIASPDVLIDDAKQRVLLYFHGMIENGDQKTRLAASENGLDFAPLPDLFDHYYYRVFEYCDTYWAISWGGYVFKAQSPEGPFERVTSPFECAPVCSSSHVIRHVAVFRTGNRLLLFFSRIGDCPERILYCDVQLMPNIEDWHVSEPRELLTPVDDWEGADLPIAPSQAGAVYNAVHALRDPHVFKDTDGRVYLSYCGAGEHAIGIVELKGIVS